LYFVRFRKLSVSLCVFVRRFTQLIVASPNYSSLVSDIRSRWVLTRGLTASGGTPLEPSMFAIEGQLSVAKARCMPWACI
jgi:hypothetical protein